MRNKKSNIDNPEDNILFGLESQSNEQHKYKDIKNNYQRNRSSYR